MRRVTMNIPADIPKTQIAWLRLEDAIRSAWAQLNRRPMTREIGIGFHWITRRPTNSISYSGIFEGLKPIIKRVVGGGDARHVYPLTSRLEHAEREHRLMLTLQED